MAKRQAGGPPRDTDGLHELRLKAPELAGLNEPSGKAMLLVVHILQPTSQEDAAAALIDLLAMIGWESHNSKRAYVAMLAGFEALLFGVDSLEPVARLVRQAAALRRNQDR